MRVSNHDSTAPATPVAGLTPLLLVREPLRSHKTQLPRHKGQVGGAIVRSKLGAQQDRVGRGGQKVEDNTLHERDERDVENFESPYGYVFLYDFPVARLISSTRFMQRI